MPEQIEGFSISRLSRDLGHSRRSLSNWLADVEPCGTESGSLVYRLADVEQAIARNLQRHRTGTAGRERLVALQCEKLAFQLSVLKRDFVAVAEVEQDVASMIQQARRVLEQGPSALAPQVVGVTIPEAFTVLSDWIQDALSRLHNDPLGTSATATSQTNSAI